MNEGRSWHEWKEAMLKAAHQWHLTVPAGFNVNIAYCGTSCQQLLRTIQAHAGIQVDGILGPHTAAVLNHFFAVPPAAARERFLTQLHWGINNAATIHYPLDDVRTETPLESAMRWQNHETPITLDCSEAIDAASFAADLVDQCGTGYHGEIFTGTLLSNLLPITFQEAQAGDLGIYGYGDGDHVVALLEDTRMRTNPLVFSHGSEIGPLSIPLLSESAVHAGQPLRWRRLDTRSRS